MLSTTIGKTGYCTTRVAKKKSNHSSNKKMKSLSFKKKNKRKRRSSCQLVVPSSRLTNLEIFKTVLWKQLML